MGTSLYFAHQKHNTHNPLITMKFILAIALICAFAFSTVKSAECTETDNLASYTLCQGVQDACDTGFDNCDNVGGDASVVSLCKDGIVDAFTTSLNGLPAQVTDCECAVMTCENSGAGVVAMGFMAVFAVLLM